MLKPVQFWNGVKGSKKLVIVIKNGSFFGKMPFSHHLLEQHQFNAIVFGKGNLPKQTAKPSPTPPLCGQKVHAPMAAAKTLAR
jgi:hypothetical protein